MSLRLSLVLVVIFAVAAIAVAAFVRNAPEGPRETLPPYFYTLDDTDITAISIVAGGNSIASHVRPEGENVRRWYFDDPADIPVDVNRWGGITVLLSGPRTRRVLKDRFDNPATYGLDDPQIIVQVTLRDDAKATIHIGNETPDGVSHYVRQTGRPELLLVDASWGEVLARLANDPPYPAWYYGETMAPKIEDIHHALFYQGIDLVRAFGYNDTDYPDKEEGWYLCDIPVGDSEPCTGATALDKQAVEEMLQPILEPQIVAVEAFGLGETFEELAPLFDKYGTGEDAPYVSLRRETESSEGLKEIWAISLSLGDLTPDGSEMYVVAMDSRDVLRVDAEWGKSILALFEAELPLAE